MTLNRNFVNVIILSWGFMLVFTAFQTMGNIEKTVLDSIKKETPDFTGEAYTSLSIIYAVLAICNWLAPSYISMTGPRVAILTGACCYVFFIAIFFWPQYILLYCASAVLGLGAALIWTGHGQYLTENSDSETMSRNAGIFWAIFQTSMFTGNLLVYFLFIGTEINASTRKIVFSVLTALAIIGTCLLTTLRKSSRGLILGEIEGANRELQIPEPRREEPLLAAWHALVDAFTLFITPSIGFTKAIGDLRVSLVGLSGIFVGIGEVVGGALFGIFAPKVSRVCGVWTVVLTGFCVHLFAFITIFLNLPNDCPFGDTTKVGFINPSPILAMAGSLALGFGDACYNTQVYSLLGTLFAQNNASAFALFKFCQSLAAAVSFAYSNVIGLYIQLLILVISIIIGTITFCLVERIARIENDNTPSETNSTFVTQ